jgi:hypothetical protein
MPISPHRLKVPRLERRPFLDLFEISQPKNVSFFRKLWCMLLFHRYDILCQGYPRRNMYFHIHYRCQICGKEKLLKDVNVTKRNVKHHPKSRCVLMFSRPDQHVNEE